MAREDVAVRDAAAQDTTSMTRNPAQAAPMAAPQAQGVGQVQQASPEEQRLYNHFVAKAMMLTYDEKMFPRVVEMLQGGGDPVEGLAGATSTIVLRVADLAEQAGQHIPGDVLLHAGTEVLEDLAELSRVAGIKDYSQDHDALEGAYFRALDMARTTLQEGGKTDPQAAARDMAMLEDMDRRGELEKALRGLAGGGEGEANLLQQGRGLSQGGALKKKT